MNIRAPWHFPRPELAKQYLDLHTAGPIQTTTIFAPRGAGKTQFLLRDLSPCAARHGFTVVYAGLGQLHGPALVLFHALEEATEPEGAWERVLPLFTPLKSNEDEISLCIDQLLARITSKNALLLLVDEAQTLAHSQEGQQLARCLHTALRKHADKARALFTGSSRAQLNGVFRDAQAPLYSVGHAVHDFPLLGREFVEFICGKFTAATGRTLDADAALDAHRQFHSRPEALVRCVVAMVLEPALTLDDALGQETARLGSTATHAATWTGLDALQRELLRTCADNPACKPFSKAALASLGARLGLPALKPTTVQKALATLSRKTVLNKTPADTWEFEDEHLRDWVKALPERGGQPATSNKQQAMLSKD